MSEYVRVKRRKWNSPDYRSMTEDGQRLFDYFITCPHGNMLGLFVLRRGYACDDLGWVSERFTKAFTELLHKQSANGSGTIVSYDETTQLLLVKNYVKHNPMANPNQIIGALKKLRELPDSELFDELKLLLESYDKPLYKPLVQRLGKHSSSSSSKKNVYEGSSSILTSARTHARGENTKDDSFAVPNFEDIKGYSSKKIGNLISEAITSLEVQGIFLEAGAFFQKHKEKNNRAILHAFCRALQNPGKASEKPWAYCKKILIVENQTYNAYEAGRKG